MIQPVGDEQMRAVARHRGRIEETVRVGARKRVTGAHIAAAAIGPTRLSERDRERAPGKDAVVVQVGNEETRTVRVDAEREGERGRGNAASVG